jgi:hypothetical protein
VQAVWQKKLRRILARRPAPAAEGSPMLTETPSGVRLRAREFTPSAPPAE